MTIRVFEAFSGIGAQAEALKELGIDYDVVGISEIDKFAIKGYEAIHGHVKNYGDIRDISCLPDCDLLTYSYPCTSVSINGRQEGMKEGTGTPSSLIWEIGRLLSNCERLPDVLLMENVDAVLNNRNITEFNKWIGFLKSLGYTSEYKILNAKDFGVPQNRKRVFMVSMLNGKKFIFPEGKKSIFMLRDFLNCRYGAPPEYYLDKDKLKNLQIYCKFVEPFSNELIQIGDLHKYKMDYMNRVYSIDGVAPCIQTLQGGGRAPKILVDDGIRYIMPNECLRLQGFPEDAIQKLQGALKSKTQLYKVAGNSIAIPCLKAIFKAIYIDKSYSEPKMVQTTIDCTSYYTIEE